MNDAAIVAVQLGRTPRGEFAVASRCPYGLPSVIRTKPYIGEEPFPTLYWLTCPAAARGCGAIESSGEMRQLNARLQMEPDLRAAYRAAHDAYVADRDADGILPGAPGAGGMPERVKCVHALLAHEYAVSNPVGAIVRQAIGSLATVCPGPCCTETADGAVVAAPGHPHMKGKH